ncbi:MerR family transcriptional regulator [uncultured Clostridium sp.]|uniref:MerR family transcriptional regulator n=1 Tax=uncultured Clostridium sp. TaxID=59620 RepID=UPI0028ED5C7D|nr:MerR family transcriptional regulator [uncultured Clostridium sp.]
MYTIGEFSKIGKVTTKMLRHYDKIGLIKPNYVNPENQYRFYEKTQIKDILTINKLKRFGFSLEEIKKIIEDEKDKNEEELNKLIKKRIDEIKIEIKLNSSILFELKEMEKKIMKGEDIMSIKRSFNISICQLEEINILSIRDRIAINEIGDLINKLFQKIYKNGLNPTGNVMTMYYDEDFDHEMTDLEVCVSVDREIKSEELATKLFKGGLHVYTTFIGPYEEIGEAYAALMDWIKQNDYKIAGAPFDKYIKGPETKCKPSEYITEVYFPVIKK